MISTSPQPVIPLPDHLLSGANPVNVGLLQRLYRKIHERIWELSQQAIVALLDLAKSRSANVGSIARFQT